MRRVALGLAFGMVLAGVPAFASETQERVFSATTITGSSGASLDSISLSPDGKLYVLGSKGSGTALWRLDAAETELAPGGLMSNLPAGAPGGITVDTAGYPHVAQNNQVGTVVRRSIDEGTTWDRGTPIATPGKTRSLASGRFNSIVEGSTLYSVNVVRNNGFLSRSTDGGLTWDLHQVLFNSCAPCADSVSNVVVTPEGDIRVVWVTAGGGLAVRYSTTGDGVIGGQGTASSTAGYAGYPSLATDSDGYLYASYLAADGSPGVWSMRPDGPSEWDSWRLHGVVARTPRVAVGHESVAITWLQLNSEGDWDLMFTTGPSLDDLEDPSKVETVASDTEADPLPDVAITTDSSNIYRIVYEKVGTAGTELRYVSVTP